MASLPIVIARRYLFARKSTNAINVISFIAILGMAVSTAVLIVFLSVFNGFSGLVESLYQQFNPDLNVTPTKGKTFELPATNFQAILKLDGVETASQVIEEYAMLRYREEQFFATIKGVDNYYNQVTGIDSALIRGVYDLKHGETNMAIIGSGIEHTLGVNLENRFTPLQIFIPKKNAKVNIDPNNAFKRTNVYVSGVFAVQPDLDQQFVFVPIEIAKDLLDIKDDRISALEIKLSEDADEEQVKNHIKEILDQNVKVENRFEQQAVLYKVMKMEKWGLFFIVSLMMAIAAFNIIGSLSMLVIEKKNDIGILKAMGASNQLIKRIFRTEGLMISVVGILLGLSLGTLLLLLQQQFGLIKIYGFIVDAYPVRMLWTDYLLVIAIVLLIGWLAAWYPSKKAANVEAIFQDS